MKRYVEGSERRQNSLFAERLDDRIGDDDPVRAIDVFVDRLDLGELGFGRVAPRAAGRPSPITSPHAHIRAGHRFMGA